MPKRINKNAGVFKTGTKYTARVFHKQIRNGETQKSGFAREAFAKKWREEILGDLQRCPDEITYSVRGGWEVVATWNEVKVEKAFSDFDSANLWLESTRAALRTNSWVPEEIRVLTLNVYASLWQEARWETKESTDTRNDVLLRKHILPRLGGLKVSEISAKAVQDWMTSLSKGGTSLDTIDKAFGLLNQLYRQMPNDGVVVNNPCATIKAPRVHRKPMVALTPAQVLKVAKEAGQWGLVIRLLAATGMRPNELAALQVQDLVFANHPRTGKPVLKIKIEKSWTVLKNGSRKLGPTKTGKNRTIPVPPGFYDELKKRVQNKEPEEWVFEGARNGNALNMAWFQQNVFRPIIEKLGIKGAVLYSLRHTFASVMFSQGRAVVVVSGLMGHASTQQTLDTYAHMIDEEDSLAMEVMDIYSDGYTGQERDSKISTVNGVKAKHLVKPRKPLITRSSPSAPEKNRTSAHGLGNHSEEADGPEDTGEDP